MFLLPPPSFDRRLPLVFDGSISTLLWRNENSQNFKLIDTIFFISSQSASQLNEKKKCKLQHFLYGIEEILTENGPDQFEHMIEYI